MTIKPEVDEHNLEDALCFPENYHWGPSCTEEVITQGGGTAVWDQLQRCYVFKTPPEWWTDCKPGDPVPEEWGLM